MQILENISLKPYHTFGLNVFTRYFAGFDSLAHLEEILEHPAYQHEKKLILGGGSNILFTGDYDGLILKNNLKGIEVIKETETTISVKAAAGENWHEFVQYCITNGFAGAENLSLIPGNAGASPMQNIGAYGVEIKDIFEGLEAYHIHDKCIVHFNLDECGFGYRESVFKKKFKDQFVILNVTYALRKVPVFHTGYGAIQQELDKMNVQDLSIRAISDAIIKIRSSKLPDPKITGNAGSFFKNPVVSKFRWHVIQEEFKDISAYQVDEMHYKIAAGWLIEKCGWKGYRNADAGCHPLQALVLVNYGNATGMDILNLSEEIIQSVKKKFGITLEREVNII